MWFIDLMNKLQGFLSDRAAQSKRCPEGKGLSHLSFFFKILFSSSAENVDRSFTARISIDRNSGGLSSTTVELMCLSPSFG